MDFINYFRGIKYGDFSSKLEKVSKVNVFIGANNSGKSRLLRSIAHFLGDREYIPMNEIPDEVKSKLHEYIFKRFYNKFDSSTRGTFQVEGRIVFPLNGKDNVSWSVWVKETVDLLNTANKTDIKILRENIFGSRSYLKYFYESNQYVSNDTYSGGKRIIENPNVDAIRNYFRNETKELYDYWRELGASFFLDPTIHLNNFYIPNLRTIKNFSAGIESFASRENFEKDNKLTNFIKVKYKFDGTKTTRISDGQELFLDIVKWRNSDSDNLERLGRFQNFLSEIFFDNQKISIITALDHNSQVKIKIGDEKERFIYDLGEGVQQSIMLTYQMFFYDYGLMYIEEPEMWMHPGFQKKLMEIYLNEDLANKYKFSKNFLYFISTHSNFIIESATKYSGSSSIYKIEKDIEETNGYNVILVNERYDTDLLKILGVSNSSVFLANCSIWVEGITDKLYFSKYLSLIIKYIKGIREVAFEELSDIEKSILNKYNNKDLDLLEGLDYTFALTAGNSIFSFDFEGDEYIEETTKIITKFINQNSLLIIDNDNNKNSDLKVSLQKALDSNLYILKVPEVENLLSSEVIQNAVKIYLPFRTGFDQSVFTKYITLSKLKKDKIGKLLNKYLLEVGITNKVGSKSGTLNRKSDFCLESLKYINYESMTDEAHQLAFKILDFILLNKI